MEKTMKMIFGRLGKIKKQKLADIVYAIFRFVILISVGYIILYPLLYMIITSFRTTASYLDPTRQWIIKDLSLEHFKRAIEFLNYGKSFLLTIRTEMVSAILEIASCAVAAYGFARFKFRFKNFFTAVLFLTILVPAPMIIIPLVTNFARTDFLGILGLLNKLTGVDLRINLVGTVFTFYLPSLLGVGLRSGILIFIYIQFFKGLPKELEEAAMIDGAGPIKTFLKIAIPSSGVVIITVMVFSLVWHWNDYTLASMYMPGNRTLAVSIFDYPSILTSQGYYTNVPETKGYMLAGCVLFVMPMLILYLILQRGFIESIDRVGITG